MTGQTIKTNKLEKGFTLIELLVVIGILAVLLAITLIAINPARQFAQANDTKRRSDVTAILNAVGQYFADNRGVLPSVISTSAAAISNTAANLCTDLIVNTRYMPALPSDPTISGGEINPTECTGAYTTGYQIFRDTSNRVTVQADSEIVTGADWTITVTR